jgi:hypothetical protein
VVPPKFHSQIRGCWHYCQGQQHLLLVLAKLAAIPPYRGDSHLQAHWKQTKNNKHSFVGFVVSHWAQHNNIFLKVVVVDVVVGELHCKEFLIGCLLEPSASLFFF